MEFLRVPESVDTIPRIGYFQSQDSFYLLLELSYGMPIHVDRHDSVYICVDGQWYEHIKSSKWTIPKRSFIVYFIGYYFDKESTLENLSLSLHVFPTICFERDWA